MKPYRRYLKDVQGGASQPKIQKLLPGLTNLKVNLTQEALRMLAFHPDAKKLCFNIVSERFSRSRGQLLTKYDAPLSRNLAKMKDLTALSMTIRTDEMQAVSLMLEIIDQNVSLDSLKEFSLDCASSIQKLDGQNITLRKILAKLTHLSTSQLELYSFFISCGNLANLSVLQLWLRSYDIPWDSKDLLQFHRFPNIQKFTLSLSGDSLPSEGNVFEHLTIPSTTEDLSLALAGSGPSLTNENHRFFYRLLEAKRVKTLNLKITTPHDGKSAAQFACLFIKCFDKLEVLNYTNVKKDLYPSVKEDKIKPLGFQDFWRAAARSKKTLRSVSVGFPLIIFPDDMSGLETAFPKLQKLQLQDSVWPATGLGKFCHQIPSLREITLKGVQLTDEEKLRMFLDGMKEIPEGRYFELYMDVKRIKQDLLINCLKKYLEDVKVKGRLGVRFTRAQIEDKQAFAPILKLAIEKGCFEPFYMRVRDSGESFNVVKTKILEVPHGFILN